MFWALVACSSGEGDTEPTVPTVPLDPDVQSVWPASFPPAEAARFVAFGDSITRGYGIDNEANTYTELLLHNNDGKWPDFAGDDLTARFGELEVFDVSRDGATAPTVISGQLPQLETLLGASVSGPTIVVGTVGGNDTLDAIFSGDLDAATDAFMADLQVITDFFLDPVRFPDGTYLAIANVYDPTDTTGQVDECFFGLDLSALQDDFDRFNDRTREAAIRNGWAWVDLRGHFVGHGFRYDEDGFWADADDPTLWFQGDCIHPNVRGHHEVRRLFLSALDGQQLPLVISE
ncbi:MAG: hypothetical protein H6738_24770 [Alphaproteobacteria bacterium]|nr:hypothetical protein [Alphaproteobacteria bacterium]MCB9700024.1 hypothetical protein [Alphaproteobacteria bacterium]